ncbi:antigenic protein, partial [Trypanosoma theileri]
MLTERIPEFSVASLLQFSDNILSVGQSVAFDTLRGNAWCYETGNVTFLSDYVVRVLVSQDVSVIHKKQEVELLKKRLHELCETLQRGRAAVEEERIALLQKKIDDARQLVKGIEAHCLKEIQSYTVPPPIIKQILDDIIRIIGINNKHHTWRNTQAAIKQPGFIALVSEFDSSKLTSKRRKEILQYCVSGNISKANVYRASQAAGILHEWVLAQLSYLEAEGSTLHGISSHSHNKLESIIHEIQEVESRIRTLKQSIKRSSSVVSPEERTILRSSIITTLPANQPIANIAALHRPELLAYLASHSDEYKNQLHMINLGSTPTPENEVQEKCSSLKQEYEKPKSEKDNEREKSNNYIGELETEMQEIQSDKANVPEKFDDSKREKEPIKDSLQCTQLGLGEQQAQSNKSIQEIYQILSDTNKEKERIALPRNITEIKDQNESNLQREVEELRFKVNDQEANLLRLQCDRDKLNLQLKEKEEENLILQAALDKATEGENDKQRELNYVLHKMHDLEKKLGTEKTTNTIEDSPKSQDQQLLESGEKYSEKTPLHSLNLDCGHHTLYQAEKSTASEKTIKEFTPQEKEQEKLFLQKQTENPVQQKLLEQQLYQIQQEQKQLEEEHRNSATLTREKVKQPRDDRPSFSKEKTGRQRRFSQKSTTKPKQNTSPSKMEETEIVKDTLPNDDKKNDQIDIPCRHCSERQKLLDQLSLTNNNLKKELDTLHITNNNLQEELCALRITNDNLREELELLKVTKDQLQKKLDQSHDANYNLQKEKYAELKDRKNYTKEVDELRQENKKLHAQLEELAHSGKELSDMGLLNEELRAEQDRMLPEELLVLLSSREESETHNESHAEELSDVPRTRFVAVEEMGEVAPRDMQLSPTREVTQQKEQETPVYAEEKELCELDRPTFVPADELEQLRRAHKELNTELGRVKQSKKEIETIAETKKELAQCAHGIKRGKERITRIKKTFNDAIAKFRGHRRSTINPIRKTVSFRKELNEVPRTRFVAVEEMGEVAPRDMQLSPTREVTQQKEQETPVYAEEKELCELDR